MERPHQTLIVDGLTTGVASRRAGVSATTLANWMRDHPHLVSAITPYGRLIDEAAFEAFLSEKQKPRSPQAEMAGEVGHANK
jgi:hypothetical protein